MNRPIKFMTVVEEHDRFDQDADLALNEPVAGQSVLNHRRGIDDDTLRLVHQVFLAQGHQQPSVVVFAAMDHGAGCSQVCASVADTLARDPLRSVCLVEANFRSPGLRSLDDTGLTEALTHMGPIRSFMRPIDFCANLWRLPTGTLHPDSPGLLASSALRERLAELREEFDVVIIDSPPVTRYADAIALGQLSDGLVLVVEAGISRRDETTAAVTSLRASNIAILAAVLNKDTSAGQNKSYNPF